MNTKDVEVEGIYRIVPKKMPDIDYPELCKQGKFIDVRILHEPSDWGMVNYSTKDKNGATLGTCTEFDTKSDYIHCRDLEMIADS